MEVDDEEEDISGSLRQEIVTYTARGIAETTEQSSVGAARGRGSCEPNSSHCAASPSPPTQEQLASLLSCLDSALPTASQPAFKRHRPCLTTPPRLPAC